MRNYKNKILNKEIYELKRIESALRLRYKETDVVTILNIEDFLKTNAPNMIKDIIEKLEQLKEHINNI